MLLWWNPGPIPSLMGVVMLGFCIAPIFPGLVSNTSQRVGRRDAANTIGMQIGAAGLGAALLPGLAGILAQRFTMESIPAFLVLLLILLIALNAATATPREEAP
jgi:fucose permease